tara:strand:- start:339 stop:602 length:264 start_codon:yes stop_codon:yes gene_type:complete
MGGEGSMMAANQSLKSNRAQLKRDRAFKGLVSNVKEKTEYNLPKTSSKHLNDIRLKLKSERRLRNLKIYLFVGVVTSILIGTLIYYA